MALAATETYSLEYNSVFGVWLDEYLGYNCYSYAVGQARPFDNFVTMHYPGCFSLSTCTAFNLDMTVAEMAELTMSDLENLGYPCTEYSTNYSDIISLSDTHNIICLRKCSETAKENYHYMRLSSNQWLHKPGNTNVLIFDFLPYEEDWFNETSFMGETYEGDRYYTGEIYYFAFAREHAYVTTYAYDNYHLGKFHYYYMQHECSGCGHTYYSWEAQTCSGPPCPLIYASVPNDAVTE